MIKKIINRSPIKSKKIYFKKGKNIISENINIFKKKYNVHRVIRLLNPDFKLIKKNMNKFMHFSIQNTAHVAGQNCLIVKIYKKGYFNGRIYKQPIFCNNNFILAKCLSAKNNINYTDLKKKDFRFCIELAVLAKFKKYKLISKPSHERLRLSGKKKVNELKDGFLMLLCILAMFIFRK